MRIGSTPAEWALLASVAVVGAAVAVLASDGPADVAVATAPAARPASPVLVVVAAGSVVDEAVARPVAEAAGGELIGVPDAGLSSSQQRALASSRPERIVVVGGRAAVGDRILGALAEQTDGSVTRLAGADRFQTAAEVAVTEFSAPVRRVLIMSGAAAGRDAARSDAASRGTPVLLVEQDRVPGATAAALRRLRPASIEVVGSAAQVADATVEQLRPYAADVGRAAVGAG